ncbi:type II toxin-antitoxin system VapC family toxin [Candidatus Tisiphia endosymbiont of Nemotelus uliginosus]|uniref:type II toxin-antitoxin system VapC family toxin n=1 Tax=Candidatus Tisiphia endosymbiont of Nemotelus uliginosus TaxID=3077926 RepID=UPI0035C89B1B
MILIDSNILLDIFTYDANWYSWSSTQLLNLSQFHELVINDYIYTEISVGFEKIEELEEVLDTNCKMVPIPKEALFLAGKAFMHYKENNGKKNSVLPDFFIGAHASILNIPLLTRDIARYKTYFPQLHLISP